MLLDFKKLTMWKVYGTRGRALRTEKKNLRNEPGTFKNCATATGHIGPLPLHREEINADGMKWETASAPLHVGLLAGVRVQRQFVFHAAGGQFDAVCALKVATLKVRVKH